MGGGVPRLSRWGRLDREGLLSLEELGLEWLVTKGEDPRFDLPAEALAGMAGEAPPPRRRSDGGGDEGGVAREAAGALRSDGGAGDDEVDV